MGHSKKYYSNLQESSIATYLNWVQISGSGSRPLHPGDIADKKWLGECKTHTTPGHRIVFSFDVWDKLEREAISQFKRPALFVDDGSQKLSKTWVMVKTPEIERKKLTADVLDCTKSKSIRVNQKAEETAVIFLRDSDVYMVMTLESFRSFLGYE